MDLIIVGLVVGAAVIFSLRSFVKIYRGEGGCSCSGGGSCASKASCCKTPFMVDKN